MMKILLVDDDIFFTKILSRQIKQAGQDVLIANDGEEALTLIEKEKPGLIFLDLMMPKVPGFTVLEKMKEIGLADIPVIIMSNLAQDSDIEKGIALGAKEYLVKSEFKVNELILKIKKFEK